ncbi:hypothetical protein GOODEAATRI_009112 [Goodea atripinnis]|uniref:Uncharacterized protein n=1 Tax=Goodea atripinnis TaxID=208336 RepID=A0ABV0MZX2_9TELE
MDPLHPPLQVTLVSEGAHPTREAEACHHMVLHVTSSPVDQEEFAPYWPKPSIQCVILSFYTATTMDRSLLRLTPHLAEARDGQAPLVAADFNTA